MKSSVTTANAWLSQGQRTIRLNVTSRPPLDSLSGRVGESYKITKTHFFLYWHLCLRSREKNLHVSKLLAGSLRWKKQSQTGKLVVQNVIKHDSSWSPSVSEVNRWNVLWRDWRRLLNEHKVQLTCGDLLDLASDTHTHCHRCSTLQREETTVFSLQRDAWLMFRVIRFQRVRGCFWNGKHAPSRCHSRRRRWMTAWSCTFLPRLSQPLSVKCGPRIREDPSIEPLHHLCWGAFSRGTGQTETQSLQITHHFLVWKHMTLTPSRHNRTWLEAFVCFHVFVLVFSLLHSTYRLCWLMFMLLCWCRTLNCTSKSL